MGTYDFLIIVMILWVTILFFSKAVLKSSSLQKAVFWTVAIIEAILLLIYFNKFIHIIFNNSFNTITVVMAYAIFVWGCERFFVTEKVKDGRSIQRTQPPTQPVAQSQESPKTQAQLEHEQWKAEMKRREELHKKVSRNEIESVIAELSESTRQPAIWINTMDADKLPLTASKFGGLPYIPKDALPPCDIEGRQLQLLAQINLCELPFIDVLPKEGVLQFWILNDRMYGNKPSHNDDNRTYQVAYHKKIDIAVNTEQVMEKYHPWCEDSEDHFPFEHEFALEFTLGEEWMESDDSRWNKRFTELWNQKHPEMEVYDLEELPNAQDTAEYHSRYRKHKILGCPDFVWENDDGLDWAQDVLLLQITSSEAPGRSIKWGDDGIAHFFIKKEALETRDFSDVVYQWECY